MLNILAILGLALLAALSLWWRQRRQERRDRELRERLDRYLQGCSYKIEPKSQDLDEQVVYDTFFKGTGTVN